MQKFLAISFVLLLCGLQTAQAQVAENTRLFRDIMDLDSQLFEQGFNQCKPNIFEKYTAEDLEFFHDIGGSQNRAEFLQAVKKNICAKPEGKPIRTLVAGSTQVFPLKNNGVLYGAIQQGVHRFHSKGSKPSVDGYTVAKFTHVWLLRDGQWKLKSALSFDHQQVNENTTKKFSFKVAITQPIKMIPLTIASISLSVHFQN